MRGRRKEYDSQLADWASRAERELKKWLRPKGYQMINLPDGKKGVDLRCTSDIEEFNVEVERRSKETWTEGNRPPFSDLTVPERRDRYGDGTLIFICRADIRRAVIVFPYSFQSERLKSKRTRYTKEGDEYFYHVPWVETLGVDLTVECRKPIAQLNAERCSELANRKPMGDFHRHQLYDLLSDHTPYGMTDESCRELLDECEREKEHLLGICGGHLDHSKLKTSKDGTHKFCPYCNRFFGRIRN